MVFSEPRYLLFFLLVFLVHWSLQREVLRKLWLLAASYAFYSAWDWRFLSLILVSTGIDFVAGRALGRACSPRRRRFWLLASLVGNLGILGTFKYFDFFVASAHDLLDWLGVPTTQLTLSIILPVGISFYTFQTMSYTLDIYFKRLRPVRSLLDFALFVGFFPQLVAGPIVRAREFLPQLEPRRFLLRVDFRTHLMLFLFGFIKKSCVSDMIATVIDPLFANPAAYGAGSIWLAVLLYAVQIYCDFSGYSDMAMASAGLLGFELPLNFDAPYFSRNVSAFWRRWHISLSSWLRDYLYIPLGGGKGSTSRTYANLMLTMLLAGLWHGAGWNFVAWGVFHGIGLSVHRLVRRSVDVASATGRLFGLIGAPVTFFWVCLLWIPFRAESTSDCFRMLGAFLTLQSPGATSLDPNLWFVFGALALLHWIAYRHAALRRASELGFWSYFALLGAVAAVALSFAAKEHEPFIYFQF